MCEYCGCRRFPEIDRLGREHEAITEIADEADAKRSDRTIRDDALRRLREALLPHANREERGVFTQARLAGLTGFYIEDLEDDHRRFDAALNNPESLDDAELEGLLKDLDRHIAIEEYDLFPAAAKRLSSRQWDSIKQMDANDEM